MTSFWLSCVIVSFCCVSTQLQIVLAEESGQPNIVCRGKFDLGFILDASGSVGASNFGKIKSFVKNLTDYFDVSHEYTRVSVMSYSTNSIIHFLFSRKFVSRSELHYEIGNISYHAGWTYTAEALMRANTTMFNANNGARFSDARQVLIILTDGASNGGSVAQPAQQLKNIGVIIYSIGVGSGVSVSQLKTMASLPADEHVYQLSNFTELSTLAEKLSKTICKVPNNETISSTTATVSNNETINYTTATVSNNETINYTTATVPNNETINSTTATEPLGPGSSASSSPDTGVIIGIVVAVVALVAVGIVVCLFYRRKQGEKSSRDTDNIQTSAYEGDTPLNIEMSNTPDDYEEPAQYAELADSLRDPVDYQSLINVHNYEKPDEDYVIPNDKKNPSTTLRNNAVNEIPEEFEYEIMPN